MLILLLCSLLIFTPICATEHKAASSVKRSSVTGSKPKLTRQRSNMLDTEQLQKMLETEESEPSTTINSHTTVLQSAPHIVAPKPAKTEEKMSDQLDTQQQLEILCTNTSLQESDIRADYVQLVHCRAHLQSTDSISRFTIIQALQTKHYDAATITQALHNLALQQQLYGDGPTRPELLHLITAAERSLMERIRKSKRDFEPHPTSALKFSIPATATKPSSPAIPMPIPQTGDSKQQQTAQNESPTKSWCCFLTCCQ